MEFVNTQMNGFNFLFPTSTLLHSPVAASGSELMSDTCEGRFLWKATPQALPEEGGMLRNLSSGGQCLALALRP